MMTKGVYEKLLLLWKAIRKNIVDRFVYFVVTALVAFFTFFVGRVSQIYSTYDGLPNRVEAIERATDNLVIDREQIHYDLLRIQGDIGVLMEEVKDNKNDHSNITGKVDDIYELLLTTID